MGSREGDDHGVASLAVEYDALERSALLHRRKGIVRSAQEGSGTIFAGT